MSSIAVAGAIMLRSADTDVRLVHIWLGAVARIVCDLLPEQREQELHLPKSSMVALLSCPFPKRRRSTQQICAQLRARWTTLTGFRDYASAKLASEDPKRWGLVLWQALHELSAFYLPSRREDALCTLTLLPYVLPCRTCRDHVRGMLADTRAMREAAVTRVDWMNLVILMHNQVSQRVKGALRARLYPMLEREAEIDSSAQQALALVARHGRSTRLGLGSEEEEEDCGCRERALEEGKVPL